MLPVNCFIVPIVAEVRGLKPRNVRKRTKLYARISGKEAVELIVALSKRMNGLPPEVFNKETDVGRITDAYERMPHRYGA